MTIFQRSDVIDLSETDHTIRLPNTIGLYIGDTSGGNDIVVKLRNDDNNKTWQVQPGSILFGDFVKVIKNGTTASSIIALTDELPSVWEPDQEPGLLLWWEIDDPNIVSSSGIVDYLPDRSGANINIQGTPIHTNIGWRGIQPSLRYGPIKINFVSGVNKPINNSLTGLRKSFTIAWTAQIWDFQQLDNFWSWGHSSGSSNIGCSTGVPPSQIRIRKSNTQGNVLQHSANDVLDTNAHIYILTFSNGALSLYIDNVAVFNKIGSKLENFDLSLFMIGGSYVAGSTFQNGNFHSTAFCVWNHALNTNVRNKLYNYLANKYMQ